MVARTRVSGLETGLASMLERVRRRISRGAREPVAPVAIPALDALCGAFRLTAFERDVLELALAAEIDPTTAAAIGRLRDATSARPTVGMALALHGADLDHHLGELIGAFAPGNQLERTGLIELVGTGALVDRELVIPASVWPRLLGLSARARVTPRFASRALADLVLAASTRARATEILAALQERPGVLIVSGPAHSGRRALASALLRELGLGYIDVDGAQLDDSLTTEVIREATLADAAVVIVGDPTPRAADRLLVELDRPLVVVGGSRAMIDRLAALRGVHEIAIAELEREAREALWASVLPEAERDPGVTAQMLAERYRFGAARTVAVARRARRSGRGHVTWRDVSDACRDELPALDTLIERLDGPYELSDLVVPARTRRELALVETWARKAGSAFGEGGPGARVRARRGLGCLFYGPSGTGKTMAAQVLAKRLSLELWRIDLARVVDKYIGETEKNLDRVFTAAEQHGALLFFDEADALFAKRTAVKDAHDRYANLEVAFLLQRIERHPGIVVLATNLAGNIDDAFSRRTQVTIEFPVPGVEHRLEIWKRHLVTDQLAPDVELDRLAKNFVLSGGQIRNAVIAAVLFAAAEDGVVAMRHLVLAVWRELAKTGRMLAPSDFGPWHAYIVEYANPGGA